MPDPAPRHASVTDASLQLLIDALPPYVDRVVLNEILARLGAPPELERDLMRGLAENLPPDGPARSDFAIGFHVKGDGELTALFNQLIRWR